MLSCDTPSYSPVLGSLSTLILYNASGLPEDVRLDATSMTASAAMSGEGRFQSCGAGGGVTTFTGALYFSSHPEWLFHPSKRHVSNVLGPFLAAKTPSTNVIASQVHPNPLCLVLLHCT
eukprot:6409405-Prymnesium_polylepis.1